MTILPIRSFRCQPCGTRIELRDRDADERWARFSVRSWRCPGCRMHVEGRPDVSDRVGLSGLPMWLTDQFWSSEDVHAAPLVLDRLFTITREALAEAASAPVPVDAIAGHATGILTRVVRALDVPEVPRVPLLADHLAAVQERGDAGLLERWRPFVERRDDDSGQPTVTFRVRPPTYAGLFAFSYAHLPGSPDLELHTCYTVWRSLPPDLEPW